MNFFVDEVGQFIGENTQLMLNLQTIAETLSTICDGQAWVFVTSQGDLDKVLGDMGGHTSSWRRNHRQQTGYQPGDAGPVITTTVFIANAAGAPVATAPVANADAASAVPQPSLPQPASPMSETVSVVIA